jgi:hypothetical protein
MSKRVTSILALCLATAGVLFIGSQAMAQAPAQIFACVNKQGAINIVGQGVPCSPNENLITWNVVGPAGATGATGPQGPAGPALGSASFFCPNSMTIYGTTQPIPGPGFTAGAHFGSPVTYDGTNFFLANAGVYQVHFNAPIAIDSGSHSTTTVFVAAWVAMLINGVPSAAGSWYRLYIPSPYSFGAFGGGSVLPNDAFFTGDALIQVPANSTVQLFNNGDFFTLKTPADVGMLGALTSTSPSCSIIFTRLQ